MYNVNSERVTSLVSIIGKKSPRQSGKDEKKCLVWTRNSVECLSDVFEHFPFAQDSALAFAQSTFFFFRYLILYTGEENISSHAEAKSTTNRLTTCVYRDLCSSKEMTRQESRNRNMLRTQVSAPTYPDSAVTHILGLDPGVSGIGRFAVLQNVHA